MNSNQSPIKFVGKISSGAIAFFAFWFLAHTSAGAQDFWKPAGQPGTGHVYALAIARDGYIFAGTGGSGVFRSADEGASWNAVNTGLVLNLTSINALAVNEDGQIFAGITTSAYVGSGVFRSIDNGDNWTLVTASLPDLGVFALAINAAGHIFAGASRGLFRSMNNGDSWAIVDTSTFVGTLKINPRTGDIFASSQEVGLIRSQDNGETWTNAGNGLGNREPADIAFSPDGQIFTGLFGQGVYRSEDGGENWTQINHGLASTMITTLAVDHDDNILAGTYDFGMFRSRNGAENWSAINSGLTNLQVRSLVLAPEDFAFIGMEGGGVFKSNRATTAVQEENPEISAGFALAQNFPNPFNPATTITYSLAKSTGVVLQIFDTHGRLVKTLINQNRPAGFHRVIWDGKTAAGEIAASGIYLYKMAAGDFVQTRKMALLH